MLRHGRRTIYANFFPLSYSGGWRCHVLDFCENSRRYFSVEYDPATATFPYIAFNAARHVH